MCSSSRGNQTHLLFLAYCNLLCVCVCPWVFILRPTKKGNSSLQTLPNKVHVFSARPRPILGLDSYTHSRWGKWKLKPSILCLTYCPFFLSPSHYRGRNDFSKWVAGLGAERPGLTCKLGLDSKASETRMQIHSCLIYQMACWISQKVGYNKTRWKFGSRFLSKSLS